MDNPTNVAVDESTFRPEARAWPAARRRPLPGWLLVLAVPFWLTVWGTNGGPVSGRRTESRAVAPERCCREIRPPAPVIRLRQPAREPGYPPGDYGLPRRPRLRTLGPTPERLLLGN
jgi:hypothetical protein